GCSRAGAAAAGVAGEVGGGAAGPRLRVPHFEVVLVAAALHDRHRGGGGGGVDRLVERPEGAGRRHVGDEVEVAGAEAGDERVVVGRLGRRGGGGRGRVGGRA